MPGHGSHLVRLRVTDTAGQSHELTQTVTVQPAPAVPRAGSYANPQRSGSNIDLHETGNGNWVLSWFTFESLPDRTLPYPSSRGEPIWYNSGVGAIVGGRFSQPLYRYTWDRLRGVSVESRVGTISLDFQNPQALWLSWVLNGVPGGERYLFTSGGEGRSGAWYKEFEPGWGISAQESFGYLTAKVAFYDTTDQPRWMSGFGWANANATLSLGYSRGEGLCPSCGGNLPPGYDPDWNHPTDSSFMTLRIADGNTPQGEAIVNIARIFPSSSVGKVWYRPLFRLLLLTKP